MIVLWLVVSVLPLAMVLFLVGMSLRAAGDGPHVSDGGHEDGGGGLSCGGDSHRPHEPGGGSPRPPGPDEEPEWWPQFEREFAQYVSRQTERSRPRTPAGRPGAHVQR